MLIATGRGDDFIDGPQGKISLSPFRKSINTAGSYIAIWCTVVDAVATGTLGNFLLAA
jgi:hypothetical protein